ncbi:MAG TPA: 16S rRNA (adenine(1518)-N(6)/adenine(1519)-N(6))-dimethyltransferase RsmA [Dehalococcoidia bacterium]|nr:16S rRNA (adenine(1518)-N(6)/adenine(1519)-N(6))-dimethyltransferase RsmA [Dehalococcoidia bacterium]
MTPRVRARKSLGQHWLTDGRYLSRIAAAADFTDADTVLEVGAGTGLLTERLATRASRLVAVEVDSRLAAALRERFAGKPKVRIFEANVLEAEVDAILSAGDGGLPYVVVGNLPYFIGTAIIRKFIRDRVRPRWVIATLQAEVAANMAAQPGHMSYLSVETQVFAEAQVLFRIPPRAFTPAPKVDSAVIRLDVHDGPGVEVDDMDSFLALARAGFAAPRKRLRNSLAIGLRVDPSEADAMIGRAGLDPGRRPAELSLPDWRALYFALRARTAEAG